MNDRLPLKFHFLLAKQSKHFTAAKSKVPLVYSCSVSVKVRHPGFQNEPRQMFKNFVFKTAQTSSIADRLIFSARFSLIKHARHWFLGFYHVARHELLVLKSINISEYQSEAFSWNVLVFLRTVNFTLFLNLMFKW